MKLSAPLIAQELKAVMLDVDGVVFDNTVFMGDPEGARLKRRCYYDGQGISLLRGIGMRVAFITNESDADARAVSELVEKLNGTPSSQSASRPDGWPPIALFTGKGGHKKLETAVAWLAEIGMSLEEAAYMGDDLVDLPLLDAVAFAAAPAQAERCIRDRVMYVTDRPGGAGAVRDLANFIMEARGIDPATLPLG